MWIRCSSHPVVINLDIITYWGPLAEFAPLFVLLKRAVFQWGNTSIVRWKEIRFQLRKSRSLHWLASCQNHQPTKGHKKIYLLLCPTCEKFIVSLEQCKKLMRKPVDKETMNLFKYTMTQSNNCIFAYDWENNLF